MERGDQKGSRAAGQVEEVRKAGHIKTHDRGRSTLTGTCHVFACRKICRSG